MNDEETTELSIVDVNGNPYASALDSPPYTFHWSTVITFTLVTCIIGGIIGWQVRDRSAQKQISSLLNPTWRTGVTVVAGTPAANEWDKRPILPTPKDAPPSLIRVGSDYYSVNYTSKEALAYYNALALTNQSKREIWLNPERDLRKDLIHELMHCALANGRAENGNGYFDPEENFIQHSSDQWLDILRNNKTLLIWWLKK